MKSSKVVLTSRLHYGKWRVQCFSTLAVSCARAWELAVLLRSRELRPCELGNDELLVTGRNEVQRPMRGKATEGQPRLAAKRSRRQPRQRAEARAERAEALVAHRKADVRNALAVEQQQFLGLLNAPAGDEFVRRFSKRAGKQTVEMKPREACLRGGVLQGDALGVAIAEIVAGAAKPREGHFIVKPHLAALSQLRSPQFSSH